MITEAAQGVVEIALDAAGLKPHAALLLENDLLRVTVLTDAGGRIAEIFDKRSGQQLLNHPGGISVSLTGEPRPNVAGQVDSMIEGADDQGVAAGWVAENAHGDLGFHLRIGLGPDASVIELECRVINRSLKPTRYNGGLIVSGRFESFATEEGALCWHGRGGLAVSSADLRTWSSKDGLAALRFDRRRSMAPRQVDTWRVSLMAFGGERVPGAVRRGIGASFSQDLIELSSCVPKGACKLLVLTESGETLEAVTDLGPETPRSFPLDPGLGAKTIALLDPSRAELLRLSLGDEPAPIPALEEIPDEPLGVFLDPSSESLGDEAFEWRNRALAETVLGLRSLAGGEFEEADRRFEQALLYNGEDHLAWWYKAVALRLAGSEREESPELLNAHYLAPLEPALRAEAFLSQPVALDPAPNPLLASFSAVPGNFVEVACLLLEAGLYMDASRWIDEAIRHVDQPMLRYLGAYCYLKGSRLDAEAASHVAAAARVGPAPHPFRRMEAVALKALSERFPNVESLRSIL